MKDHEVMTMSTCYNNMTDTPQPCSTFYVVPLSIFRDKPPFKPTLRDLQNKSGSNPSPIPAFSPEHQVALLGDRLLDTSPVHTVIPPIEMTLTDVFVPLESIKPSKYL
jgi:hypothetical protein